VVAVLFFVFFLIMIISSPEISDLGTLVFFLNCTRMWKAMAWSHHFSNRGMFGPIQLA
jgi:hypothetical protein